MRLLLSILAKHARRHPRASAMLALTTVLSTLIWVAEPLYTRYAIDQLTTILDGTVVSYVQIFGWWIAIFVTGSMINGFDKYFTWNMGNMLLVEYQQAIYRHILTLDVEFHVSKRSGEVVKKMENAANEARDLFRSLIDLVPSFFSSAAFLVISFFIHWALSLILLTGVALYVFFSIFLSIRLMKLQSEINDIWLKSLGRAYDAMANIFAVKSASREEDEFQTMRNLDSGALESQSRINKAWAKLEAVNFYALIRIALVGIGTIYLVYGELTLGELYYFQYVFFRILTPFEILSNLLPDWNEKIGKIRYAEQLLTLDIDIQNKPNARTMDALTARIELRDVSFAYGETDTVRNLTFSVRPGEHIALVGHSGAGKSTVASLINRFYDVTSGAILIDGMDLRDLDVHWWRRQIGLVLQENILFNDTVLENIRYARPDASIDEVKEAAKRASADVFIERLPKQYDTEIGERGVKLSGGERQRVAIARTILKKPTIVVLDEATSALDSITERQVQEGIKELIKGRTAIIIAHRLSTVRAVDRIAVLEDGRLIAFAPHDELLKTCPSYKHMVELQHGGILAD